MTGRYDRKIKFFGVCLYLCALWVWVPFLCQAQEDRHHEYLLKSAFIERFTRFVQWPLSFDDGVQHPAFVFGALCEPDFCRVLEAAFAEHQIKNRPVKFRRIKTAEDVDGCHLVYIGKTDDSTLAGFITALKSKPVLTVSDTRGYAQKGVHINMFVQQEQIRFEINHKSAVACGLKISHLLLQLAKIVETEKGSSS
nr:YfiR family protein [uncultured Desulfobacter sp.]